MNDKNLIKILVIISIFSIIMYLIYNHYAASTPKQIPLIEPDDLPTKIKPTDAGGMIVPNSDNAIYDNMGRVANSRKINILPEPEQALALVGQKINTHPEHEDSIDSMLATLFANEKINKINDDDNPPLDSIFEENFKAPDMEELDNLSLEQSEKALNIIKVTEGNKKIAKVKNTELSSDGKYKIQLASMKTQSLAISEGERLKHKHPKILGNMAISQKKVQQEGGQFFYVVLAGDYPSLSKAKAACKKLSARQQSCMIYHP